MEKYDNEYIGSIVDMEGLDYSIMHKISPENIEDEELAKLWKEANIILQRIESKLGF